MANVPTKPTAPVKKESTGSSSSIFATLAIPICLVVSISLYIFILGDPSHYEGGDLVNGKAVDIFGIIHKGGPLVPVVLGYILMVIVFLYRAFYRNRKSHRYCQHGNLCA